ncbi:hypothetical protein [Neobacillus sp. Marseille-QA0830]
MINLLREITLLVHGRQFFHEPGKPSSYEYVLIDEETGKKRRKTSDRTTGETSNRAIILGVMDALSRLNDEENAELRLLPKRLGDSSR